MSKYVCNTDCYVELKAGSKFFYPGDVVDEDTLVSKSALKHFTKVGGDEAPQIEEPPKEPVVKKDKRHGKSKHGRKKSFD